MIRKRTKLNRPAIVLAGLAVVAFSLLVGLQTSRIRAATLVGDVNSDGKVNVFDLSTLLSHWGTAFAAADFNNNGNVEVFDLSILLSHWGTTATVTPTPTHTPTPTATATATPSTTPTPTAGGLTYAQVNTMVTNFASTHSGKATDIYKASSAEPAAKALRDVCGTGWASVYPKLTWEYGGADHPWIGPAASPLLICVHMPTRPPYAADWKYAGNQVTANVYVKFPTQSPCGEQLLQCMQSETSNMEILVDHASGLDDGHSVGLELSVSTTELYLKMTNGTLVHLWSNI